ncbi:hypothetical protein L7F22_034330 [Adiantum nelumboides]|nr:hypothetical protein [Adiantum nelumboides]
MPILTTVWTEVLIPIADVIGIAFSLLQWYYVSFIFVSPAKSSDNNHQDYQLEEGPDGPDAIIKCAEIQEEFSLGANFVSLHRCVYSTCQECAFALILTIAFTIVTFILGVVTSVLFGFFGMRIATYANMQTTLEARKGVGKAFIVAFCSGSVMGFLLATNANGLLVLYITINLFKIYYGTEWEGLLEAITGYGLGSSSVALFGRVGGGIYTKAADVRADLVGKVERGIPKDDPRNPAIIADNVGDNVGDIVGMGSDLFGSFAKSSCAALVVASIAFFGTTHDFTAMCFPLLISSMGKDLVDTGTLRD